MTRRNKSRFSCYFPDSDDLLSLNFHRFIILYISCDTRSVGLGQHCLPKVYNGFKGGSQLSKHCSFQGIQGSGFIQHPFQWISFTFIFMKKAWKVTWNSQLKWTGVNDACYLPTCINMNNLPCSSSLCKSNLFWGKLCVYLLSSANRNACQWCLPINK